MRRLSTILVLALAAGGCRHQPAPMRPIPPPLVEVEPAIKAPVTDHAELTGRIVATETVEVRPRISGHIQAVRFEAGQIVEQGQVLFTIDPRWQQAEVARTTAQVQAAEARLAVAEKELARAETLATGRAISAEELEARASRTLEARATAAAARASRDSAQLDLEFTEIRSPIRGRVSRPLVTTGNHVSGVAGLTTVMTTVVSVDPVHYYCDLDEGSFLRFERTWRTAQQNGEPVRLRLALSDEQDFPHEGRVESLDNRLDPNSGTMLVRGIFANPDGRLVAGLYAKARLPLSAPREAVLVAERAIGTEQNQRFVLVVDAKGLAEYRRVTLGGLHEGRREVKEGVQEGERVIVAGQQRARAGQPVQIAQPAGKAGENAAPSNGSKVR